MLSSEKEPVVLSALGLTGWCGITLGCSLFSSNDKAGEIKDEMIIACDHKHDNVSLYFYIICAMCFKFSHISKRISWWTILIIKFILPLKDISEEVANVLKNNYTKTAGLISAKLQN